MPLPQKPKERKAAIKALVKLSKLPPAQRRQALKAAIERNEAPGPIPSLTAPAPGYPALVPQK